jgi:ketosteroid isomerase-like protein
MSQDDITRLRDGYEALNRGDLEVILDRVHPDFEAHDRAEVPDPQRYEGVPGITQALGQLLEEFDDYRMEPQEFIDGGDRIIVVLRQSGRGRASGAVVEGTIVHLWEIRDGRASGLRAFSDLEEALEAAGLSG